MRLHDLLRERGWTAYRLAKEAGLTMSLVYRLAAKEGRFVAIQAETLDRICGALDVGPGALFRYRKD